MTEAEAFAEELLNNYINGRLKKDKSPVPKLHRFLFDFYPPEKLSILLMNLARFSVFNAFSEDLSDYLENELNTGSAEKSELRRDIRYAVYSYQGLRLYKSKQDKSAEEWEVIFGNLMKAWDARPLRIDAEVLVEAAKKTKQKRALFELLVYFYYDREKPGFPRRAGLFFRYLITPDKKGGFRKELQQAREKLKEDILLGVERETPDTLPSFSPSLLYSMQPERQVTFDFSSPASPVHGSPLILSFFSTKCSHCLTELEALGQIRNELQTSMQAAADYNVPLFAAVNTNLPSIEKVKEHMPRYIEENEIEIGIYSNVPDRNALILRYGVSNVPLVLLFDETGTPLARVRFNHMGHVKLKLQWILEEYLHADF